MRAPQHFQSSRRFLHWIKAKTGLHREPTTQSIKQASEQIPTKTKKVHQNNKNQTENTTNAFISMVSTCCALLACFNRSKRGENAGDFRLLLRSDKSRCFVARLSRPRKHCSMGTKDCRVAHSSYIPAFTPHESLSLTCALSSNRGHGDSGLSGFAVASHPLDTKAARHPRASPRKYDALACPRHARSR